MRRFKHWFFGAIPWVCLGVSAFAVALRLTLRDSWFAFAAVYYAFPLSVCAFLAFLSAFMWRRRNQTRKAVASLAWGTTIAVWFAASACEFHSFAASEAGVRVVFWNVYKGRLGWEGIADVVAAKKADIVVLVEITPKTTAMREFWAGRFPEYHVVGVDRSMILLSRFKVTDDEMHGLEGMGNVRIYEIELPSGTFDLIHADLDSKPFQSRRPAFEKLLRQISKRDKHPSLLMGDFNTPSDSALFDPIRTQYRNVFEAAGRGLNVTWPMPLPVLALDQLWASPHWELLSCDIQSSARSDHRMIVADLNLK